MTDSGPEHRPPPPPPPPPTDLAPPPGYTAYAQNLSSSVELKRIGGIAKAMVILLAVYVLGQIINLAGTPRVVEAAQDFVDGRISDDDFLEDVGVYGLTAALSGLAQIAIVVLTIIWTFRIVKNHRTIGRQTTWGPGMAIGGWFLPPFLYVIPTLVLREAWKAADPAVPPGDQRWKSNGDNPLLWAWFLVYGVATFVLSIVNSSVQFRQFGGDADDLADVYADSQGILIAMAIVGIISAVLWALVVRQWTARHTALTGEARG